MMIMDKNTKWIIFVVIIVCVLAALYAQLHPLPQGSEPQPLVSNITVVNSNGSYINGVYVINGTLQNKNPFKILVVNLNATGYSNNGSIVDTGNGFTTTSPITSGGTSNFSIFLYDPNKLIKTYKLQVEDASR
jgi:hypothetical protein